MPVYDISYPKAYTGILGESINNDNDKTTVGVKLANFKLFASQQKEDNSKFEHKNLCFNFNQEQGGCHCQVST
mgnify:FL=1